MNMSSENIKQYKELMSQLLECERKLQVLVSRTEILKREQSDIHLSEEQENFCNEHNINENKVSNLLNIVNKHKHKYKNINDAGKDYNSISYIIKKNLTQSQLIKFGINLEKIFVDIILEKNKNLVNIKPKNKKNKKEKDHLFIDEFNKIIYYAEIKSNLNLDTEKSKQTIDKLKFNHKELCNEYTDYKINTYLVGSRYFTKSNIPVNIINKYIDIKDYVNGINEYFLNLNCDIHFNENEYNDFINGCIETLLYI